jgi:hypothetical protein
MAEDSAWSKIPNPQKATIGTRPSQRNPAFLRRFFVSVRQCVLLRATKQSRIAANAAKLQEPLRKA